LTFCRRDSFGPQQKLPTNVEKFSIDLAKKNRLAYVQIFRAAGASAAADFKTESQNSPSIDRPAIFCGRLVLFAGLAWQSIKL